MFELTNDEREYLGLDFIQPFWDAIKLKAGPYQPESKLFFEDNLIKKQIINTESRYYECPLNIYTRDRSVILPRTSKGKEKKLTAATIEKYKPDGVSFEWVSDGSIFIYNHNTQVHFYSNYLEDQKIFNLNDLSRWLKEFIEYSNPNHLNEIESFRGAERKNIRYKAGDFFAFQVSRDEYGYGRILLDINKLRKKKYIDENHGLQLLMGTPLLIKIYAYTSKSINTDLEIISEKPALPSDYIMDNHVFYGEYPVLGNIPLRLDEYDFPISFGRSIDYTRGIIFLQWGFINLEKPGSSLRKYQTKNDDSVIEHNPYGYYSCGFYSRYSTTDIKNAKQKGRYEFDSGHFKDEWDLRNPRNAKIRRRIFKHFGLYPNKTYKENCELLGIDPIINAL